MVDDSARLILIHELTDGMFDCDVDTGVTADIPANSHCYISGDGVITPFADDCSINECKAYLGYTVKPWNYGADGKLALQTKFRNLVEMTAGGTINAGQYVRFEYGAGALIGQVVPWVPGTDDPEQIVGMCWVGGDDTETIQVLTF